MKTTSEKISRLTALALLFLFACSGTSPGKSAIDWEEDYELGLALAKERGRPAMVFFTADW